MKVSWGSAKTHAFLDDALSEKDGSGKAVIKNNGKGDGLSSELHIKKIQRAHSDTYYCRGTNAFGGDTLAIHLRVKGMVNVPVPEKGRKS